ncbi:hypothetical protein HRG_000730 [Hirsutella rhossiliensis]|uniref:Uncharacterized protein n=1 Tax=Hirsutella rhossiliensis TaxID=111463 RepID=A0A9P8SM13_9HYPO|nr:uncharacterized protein HRG_00730 [Hirsutella rhossiliensis]KAH0968088.1 hypothetical protein HRG_00730 [Hirsutella rhossiliensis]
MRIATADTGHYDKDVRKNVKDSDDRGADADLVIGDDPLDRVVPGGSVDEAARNYKKAKRQDEEEGDEMDYMTLQRLGRADEHTKVMTREEYVIYSGYRQTSFTWHNGKRFREWASSGEGKTPIEAPPHPGGLS